MSALTLADAKTHLNMSGQTNDVELQGFIDAAEGIVAAKCGPLEPTTVVRRVRSDGATLVLPVVPVLSVTSVVPALGGTPVDVAALVPDPGSGVVSPIDYFSLAVGAYVVTYQAGRTEVPDDLLMAVKEMTRHLWRTQRGGAQRPGSSPDTPVAGYLVPNAVAALMEPHVAVLGIA